MGWRILADTVMGLHLLLVGFFAVSVILLVLGFFKGRRNWQRFYCGVTALAISLGVAAWAGVLTATSSDNNKIPILNQQKGGRDNEKGNT